MAQILTINSKTKKTDNELGDVVDIIFSDDHEFTGKEKDLFDVVSIEGTAAEIKKAKEDAEPPHKTFWSLGSQDWSETPPEECEAWHDGKGWYKIEKHIQHKTQWDGEKFVHTFDRHAENKDKKIKVS